MNQSESQIQIKEEVDSDEEMYIQRTHERMDTPMGDTTIGDTEDTPGTV